MEHTKTETHCFESRCSSSRTSRAKRPPIRLNLYENREPFREDDWLLEQQGLFDPLSSLVHAWTECWILGKREKGTPA